MGEFTLVGLRVVRAAARHGSFSTAAERLGYTQSAVSRQIALMEQAAGQALFERRARGVVPTEAGRVVVRRAEAVLAEVDAARQDLGDLPAAGLGRPGRLRVGAFSTAMAALVPRAIAALLRQEPRARVPLREGLSPGLLTAVARGRLDVAVVTLPERAPTGVEVIPLLDDPLLVAVPPDHRLAGRAAVAPAALRHERWIAGSGEPGTTLPGTTLPGTTLPGTTLLGAWRGASWQPDIAFVARDWVAKLGLVRAGLGITVVPGLAVPAVPASIPVVRIDHPTAVRTTAVALRRTVAGERRMAAGERHTAAGERRTAAGGRRTAAGERRPDAFVEALRDVAADLSAELRHRLRVAPSS